MTDFWGNPTKWKGDWIVDFASVTISNEEYLKYFDNDDTWEEQQRRFLKIHRFNNGHLEIAQIVEGWEDE